LVGLAIFGSWTFLGSVIRIGGLIADAFSVAKMLTNIHGQTSCSTTETVSFRSEFPSVAVLAVDFSLMLGAVGGVKKFVAKTAFEAGFVPLLSTGEPFLSSVHGFAAFGAFWVLWRLERHSDFGYLAVGDPKSN